MYGERIKKLRKMKNWTQQDLAEKIGVSRNMISNYEKEKKEPSVEKYKQMADLFGVTMDYLTGRTNEFSSERKQLREFLNQYFNYELEITDNRLKEIDKIIRVMLESSES